MEVICRNVYVRELEGVSLVHVASIWLYPVAIRLQLFKGCKGVHLAYVAEELSAQELHFLVWSHLVEAVLYGLALGSLQDLALLR